ncbi:hypothetical protein HDU96_002923 [Phlyctochytrium bullatum]|nr:hypothetical protein HDU96_002923 [Phlyctochytrium bullatum]
MILGSILVAAVACAAVVRAAPAQTNSLYTCRIKTEFDADTLSRLDLDVWTHRIKIGSTVDVRTQTLKEAAALNRALACTLKTADVYADVAEPAKVGLQAVAASEASLLAVDTFFNTYATYDQIVAKLQSWATTYPNLTTYVPSVGKSYQGRDIPAIIITDKSVPDTNKQVIWWNGGQHAREWIGPATVMYQSYKLLTLSTTAPVSTFLSKVRFVITPIQNPDGYIYTFTTNRLWRKNRRNNGDGTYGVDLNRNWDEHWGVAGASSRTSSDTYKGKAPFSEPETKSVSDYILTFPNRLAAIDFHSYSQLVLRNWGWTSTLSQNEAILKKLGDGVSAAIKAISGKSYTSEPGASLYPAAGCTDDWSTTKAGMVGYTIELRDTGSYGFRLPATQIIPTGDEIWNAMLFFVDFVLNNKIPYNPAPAK